MLPRKAEAAEVPLFKRIDHVALHVSDIDRSIAFYKRHFGCETYYEHTGGRGFRCIQEPHLMDARAAREQGWRRIIFEGLDGEAIELRG